MNAPLPHPAATPATPPAAPSPALPLRVLRACVLLGLCLCIDFLLLLAAVACFNPVLAGGERFGSLKWLIGGLALGVPALLLWLACRLRLQSWRWLGGGWLVMLPVLAYLAVDDLAIRRPLNIAELAPAFPGAEKSYAVLMRYTANTPATEAFEFTPFSPPKEADQLPAYAEAKREQIERRWEALLPQRQWYDELSAFERIGDLGEASTEAPVPAYAPHRALAQTAQLKAILLALDGRGDEAIAILVPVLDVTGKIQSHSRSLVRMQIGFVCRRMALDAADFVLTRTPVSAAMRARLAAALGPVGGEAAARRLVAIEYVGWASGSVIDMVEFAGPQVRAPFRQFLRLWEPLLLNPNRTINEMGDILAELQDLAARRQPMTSTRSSVLAGRRLPMKNLLGQIAIYNYTPAFQKIVDAYWRTEDRLAAVRARLVQP